MMCHCEERSDAAISQAYKTRLLRFTRNGHNTQKVELSK